MARLSAVSVPMHDLFPFVELVPLHHITLAIFTASLGLGRTDADRLSILDVDKHRYFFDCLHPITSKHL